MIASGSTNAIPRHYDCMNATESALRMIRGCFAPMDVLKVSYGNQSKIQLCGIAFGLIGDLNAYSEGNCVRKFGPGRFVCGGLNALCCMPQYSVKLSFLRGWFCF